MSAEDIEGGEWMDHETERKANGEETLKLQASEELLVLLYGVGCDYVGGDSA